LDFSPRGRFWILDWETKTARRNGMKRIQPSMALGSLSDNLKSKIRNPKWGWSIAITVTLALCGALAQAQQQTKVYRIGFLATISFSAVSARTNAF
jgi:hypothetical protein